MKRITIFSCSVAVAALASCNRTENGSSIETDTTRRGLVTDCDFLNPGLYPALPIPVIYDHELMITDISVVEDPCRTTWYGPSDCPSDQVGAWTFGQLIREMSGDWSAPEFAGEILNALEFGGTVNGYPVSPRPNIRYLITDPWLIASGCPAGSPVAGKGYCPLDITLAPFRLLAIVNRLDLSGTSYGSKSPGEGRFVFGFIDAGGNALNATIIFEYELHAGMDIFGWANHWNQLSALPLPSTEFNNHLQSITDQFISQGTNPGGPNHDSSISQIRTNETDFGSDWVLRQFKLQEAGYGFQQYSMLPDTVSQNPDDSFNLTDVLSEWMSANEASIQNLEHVVPPDMLGGETRATFFWEHSGGAAAFDPMARHLFAFATCNGCHLDETQTNLTHVNVRAAGVASTLSTFMSASTASGGGGLPASGCGFSDPWGLKLDYNEPWRRVCEETRILHGDPNPFTKANGAH